MWYVLEADKWCCHSPCSTHQWTRMICLCSIVVCGWDQAQPTLFRQTYEDPEQRGTCFNRQSWTKTLWRGSWHLPHISVHRRTSLNTYLLWSFSNMVQMLPWIWKLDTFQILVSFHPRSQRGCWDSPGQLYHCGPLGYLETKDQQHRSGFTVSAEGTGFDSVK